MEIIGLVTLNVNSMQNEYETSMGEVDSLKDQLELGLPVEEAMLLSGYSFEEIEDYKNNEELMIIIKMSSALFMRRHLTQIVTKSDERPQLSQWLLERLHPEKFGTKRDQEPPINFPSKIILEGVYPGNDSNKEK